MITIGSVLKAQGIKGEIKVAPLTDDIRRFQGLKEVFAGDTSFAVTAVRIFGGFVYLRLAGIDDRNAAEALAGRDLRVARKDAVRLPKGRYFVEDILGCGVYVGARYVGNVAAIDNFGSADVYTVTGDRTVRFPLLRDLLVSVDLGERTVQLDEKRFGEVAVYED